MVAIELVLRDALAFEHRQYMETNVVDHLVVPGDHQSIAFEAGFEKKRERAQERPCLDEPDRSDKL